MGDIALVFRNENEDVEGYWVDYPLIEGVSFKIKPISFFEESALKEEVKKEVLTIESDNVELKSYDNHDLFLIEKVNSALVDWRGIGSNKYTQAECTRENKLTLIKQQKAAMVFILNVSDNVDLYMTEKLKQEKKS